MLNTSRIPILLPILFTSLIFFSSCKDDFNPTSDLNGTKEDIRAMLSAEDITQRKTVPSDAFRFVSERGALITADPYSFVKSDGSLYTGDIVFEVTELQTKSEIIKYGVQTLTLDNRILESEGEFYFEANGDGEKLSLAPDKELKIQVPSDEIVDETELFILIENLWVPEDSIPVNITEFQPNGDAWSVGYEVFVDEMRWVNFDWFAYETDFPVTAVAVELPEGYSSQNSIVLPVFSDRDIVLEMGIDRGGGFIAILPEGEKVHFVAIAAEDDNTFRYDSSEETIAAGLVVQLDPKEKSEDDINQCLKDLD